MNTLKILVTGGNGQLGTTLKKTAPAGVDALYVDVDTLDITKPDDVMNFIASVRPGLIINAAAYTAVDKAESDENTAYRINCIGVANLANAAIKNHARILHVSTDFVFGGNSGRPYRPNDPINPLSVYGRTKAAGEQELRNILPQHSAIVRTAWLYSAVGSNFMKTILKLMTERDVLRVVSDQVGTPTGANTLAQVLWELAFRPQLTGIFHCTDAGVASWYDFALAIREEGESAGILSPDAGRVEPINTSDYPTPARRPYYSVLDKTSLWHELGITPIHWRRNLRNIIAELRSEK
jgi:dTDP-4-dehydrorhamnose reductase